MGSQTGSHAPSQGHKQGHTCRHGAIHGVTCIVMGSHMGVTGTTSPSVPVFRAPPPARVPRSPCPHRVVEVLDGELGEPLRHQLLLAAGGDLLEPGEGPRCPGGGTQVFGGGPGGQGGPRVQGGGTPRGDLGIPGGTQASGGDLGGAKRDPEDLGGGHPCVRGEPRRGAPLQLLAVLQQSLQVSEAEGSVEAVPVWPRLPDVGILLEQVLGAGGGWSDRGAWAWGHPRRHGDTPELLAVPHQCPLKAPSAILVSQSCSQCHNSALKVLPVPNWCPLKPPRPTAVPFKASQSHTGAHLNLLLVDVIVLGILLVQHRQLQPL